MMTKDMNIGKTGALFYAFAGLGVSIPIPAIFAYASFFAFVPWLNLATAVLLTPALLTFLYIVFAGRTRMEIVSTRVITAVVSLIGAWVYICVMTAVLSGVFGANTIDEEITNAIMRETKPEFYLSRLGATLGFMSHYAVSPYLLFQDITAWYREGWHTMALAALCLQIGLPQVFIRKRSV
jgi:hypothetical protein